MQEDKPASKPARRQDWRPHGAADMVGRQNVKLFLREPLSHALHWEAPRGTRPEVGGGAEATADSSPASRLTFSSQSVGEILLVMGPSRSTSPRVRSLNFRFCRLYGSMSPSSGTQFCAWALVCILLSRGSHRGSTMGSPMSRDQAHRQVTDSFRSATLPC